VGGMVDRLRGLKENVIMGRIIPAGTGIVQHQDEIAELYQEGLSGADLSEADLLGAPAEAAGNGHDGTSDDVAEDVLLAAGSADREDAE
jgi:DNA-directed RNA polymerase subunit beta'